MPPSGSIPAPLPPSVETAYRQKCIDLKKRINEVEESNDALRLRRARTKRGILKLRLERAFLLEQLAKRTAENVEDSDGSPSPPPPPQEKPLRTKRPHARPPLSPARPPSPLSSATTPFPLAIKPPATSTPRTPFAIFCAEIRPALEDQARQDPEIEVDKALAQAWRDLGSEGQGMYVERLEGGKVEEGAEEGAQGQLAVELGIAASSPAGGREAEDVDMEGGDGGEVSGGGFTAVNR